VAGGGAIRWRTVESGLGPEDWIAIGSERMKQGKEVKISAEDFARDLLLLRVRPGTAVAPVPVASVSITAPDSSSVDIRR
jgi:hypothetical protein